MESSTNTMKEIFRTSAWLSPVLAVSLGSKHLPLGLVAGASHHVTSNQIAFGARLSGGWQEVRNMIPIYSLYFIYLYILYTYSVLSPIRIC